MVKEKVENFEDSSEYEELAQKSASGSAVGNRSDFRVVQTDQDKDGKTLYKNIGGMWKNVSKSGNEFYTLKIGNLKLLVFPNSK